MNYKNLSHRIEWDNGIHINGLDLVLDSTKSVECAFVSHAHFDHIAKHELILASPATANLCAVRLKSKKNLPKFREVAYHRPLSLRAIAKQSQKQFDDIRIELLPAGHILGSAQIRITHGNQTLLYTGDFRLKPSLTAEPIIVKPADILVMDATYGDPAYIFPPREKELKRLKKFIDTCLANGVTPVLLAYSLGKAQEMLKYLGDSGYPLTVHPRIAELAEIYTQFGIEFAPYKILNEKTTLLRGRVILVPPNGQKNELVASIRQKRVAILTGWAVDDSARWRYGADKQFIISDHADYQELLDYVSLVNPNLVYICNGEKGFVKHLQKKGFDAHLLEPTRQLTLFE
ncbi:MAG: MBL fold metallo-hydrolase [bacterium]|nr:MBL fold metallo-hydrolase [bacterium]